MEKENHIYIYSPIGSYEGEVSLESVKKQYNPDSKRVIVHINSPGGEVSEGRAIFDFIKEIPQPVHTVGEGMVASIATLAFLAGETREMKPNCDFLAHLPSIGIEGNSDQIERANEYMQQKKRDIAGIYAQYTGKSVDEMIEFMRQDTPISAQVAKELGFATFIPEFKAVARINLNNLNKKENKMEAEKEKEEVSKLDILQNKMTTMLNKVVDLLTDEPAMNMNVELEDGNMIFVESEDGELEGKVAFTTDEEGNRTDEFAPEGVHALKDGRSITVGADGIVVSVEEVVEAKETEVLQNEIKELKAKLETLIGSNESLENEKKELAISNEKTVSEFSEMKNTMESVMNEIKSFRTIQAGGEAKVAKSFIKPEDKLANKEVSKSSLGAWGTQIFNKK